MSFKDEIVKLNAEQLKDLTDDIIRLGEEKLSDAELKGRADSAASFFKAYFDKVIRLMEYEQLRFMAIKAPEEAWMMCRGTINGLYIVQEWFKRQNAISKAQIGSPEWVELFGEDSVPSITDKLE